METAVLAPEAQDGSSRPGPARLNHSHQAIARWLLENPTAPLSECAKHFGYTQAWLSCIIHSDAFQVHYRKLQTEADAVTVLDIPARLRGVASDAVEALHEQVEYSRKDGNGVLHRQFLLNTAELTLKSLGFGQPKSVPAPVGFNQQNNFHFNQPVPVEVLAGARERILNANGGTPALQETSKLPAGDVSDVSQVQRLPSTLSASAPAEGAEASGADLRSEGERSPQ